MKICNHIDLTDNFINSSILNSRILNALILIKLLSNENSSVKFNASVSLLSYASKTLKTGIAVKSSDSFFAGSDVSMAYKTYLSNRSDAREFMFAISCLQSIIINTKRPESFNDWSITSDFKTIAVNTFIALVESLSSGDLVRTCLELMINSWCREDALYFLIEFLGGSRIPF